MPSANLTEADADNILASMSNVLRAFDGADDIDCNVAFCRGGNIGEYAIDDGIVDTQGEIDAVFALPETVKVAREIDFCNNNFDVLIAGCARGGTFIVERTFIDGALWAHEYGHTRGLAHRNPDDPNAVMNSALLSTTRRVNSRECFAYHLGASLAAVDVSMLGSAPTPAVTNEAAQLADIRDFVRQNFIHGTPYDDIMRYDSSVVPTLLEMLEDPQEEQAWPNIVIVLGILGDNRAVTPLISFIEQGEGEINYWRYKAKKNAIVGLGYLVAKSGDEKALAYLREGIEPSAWVDRGIKWTSPDREAATARNRELSRMAIIGLGVSGHPSAVEALRALLTPAPTATGREFREQMSGVISEALKANQRIAKDGLAEYYRKSTP